MIAKLFDTVETELKKKLIEEQKKKIEEQKKGGVGGFRKA